MSGHGGMAPARRNPICGARGLALWWLPLPTLLAASIALVACQSPAPQSAAESPQNGTASRAVISLSDLPAPPSGSAGTAPLATPVAPAYPRYANGKADFHYGAGQPWPRLVLPPTLLPGLLAAVPGSPPPLPLPLAGAAGAALASGAVAPAALPCATEWAAQSLDIGPKEGWLGGVMKSVTSSLISKALGGFGPLDDGDMDEPEAPPTVRDPIPKSARQAFHDRQSDIELLISGRLNDDGLLLSSAIDDAPGKPTFHAIYLEDPSCRRQFPDRFLNYRIWLEWSLSVSWSKTRRHYQNDQLVSQQTRSGGFFKSGEIDLANGRVELSDAAGLDAYQQGLLADLPEPIWQQLGFSAPTAGIRALGAQFDRVDATALLEGGSIAVVHLTRVVDDRYVTRALPFRITRGKGDLLRFSRL